ncbi:DNA-directed RNA polymerase I subunit RPA1-like protein [Sarcoptes scabiei]|uniref:DNA-directed RNA polymerase subunit n=1 Tax=Sarcoptes scabiei TaxID=52283 RepID=A0A131ZXB1_SARSC|nr:DNA-directed RNA polymerase I subunit RPA1-like protein [Sarcoptes scabiei]
MQSSTSQIVGIQFKLFSSNEIEKLSVLPVTNIQTFDPLGHPLENSLADTALDAECLGHFGHIKLPLPVFNPFLMKQIFQILKMFCFDCQHLLLTPFNVEIFIAQIQALNLGLDYDLDKIRDYASEISNSVKGFDWGSIEGRTYLRGKLNDLIWKEINLQNIAREEINKKIISDDELVEAVNSKNIVEKKQNLFKNFFNCKIIKPTRVCGNCNARKRSLNVINKSLIVISGMNTDSKIFEYEVDDASAKSIDMKGKSYLTPLRARDLLRKFWFNEKDVLKKLFPFLKIEDDNDDSENCPMDVFFWEKLVVTPNRFRPLRHLNGRSFEHPQTSALSEIMLIAKSLEYSLEQAKKSSSGESIARFHHQWQRLQILCNRVYDSSMDNLPDNKSVGVKQILEKKEGLMRKNMMGKRVNFAARSVISPDPYIMTDEIGIPLIFATKLSYPQTVADWNIKQLKQMIINGPNKHPGALSITYGDGYTVRLKPDDINQRMSLAATLHTHSSGNNRDSDGITIVNRHLITGDVLLVNRQPTLHKPSIMAHRARVLPKEKTLRLHYANCKCYNADFDGDEMNAHFPQSELARAEAYNIASVNNQFLVPKDGSPLSGLIQDHIVAGVLLTTRGRFFNKNDYQELIYGSLSFLNCKIDYLPPAIYKPERLWSGKQIISTLLRNIIPKHKLLPSFENESKISSKLLITEKPNPKSGERKEILKEKEMCDSQVIFRNGELLSGIMDKVNLGANKNGLIHVCYELYGDDIHSKLLTAIARLCTNFLQYHHGFTLGIHDILVKPKPESKRRKLIKASKTIGRNAVTETFSMQTDSEEILIKEKLQTAQISKNNSLMKQLDASYKSQTDSLSNEITEHCMPKGLLKPFPQNNLQMMIQTGAKGGSVNAIQISCLLGQIELEGRRIPLMMSGRTLPSFRPYEIEPRAGGFVTGRFLSGIRPQEFFFHCMAGREGLIDTAVKTSRSGYLQRCLIKHLEGLVVNYDLTVRDSEGSVIQWLYGEDGLDVLKSQSLKKSFFPTILSNKEILRPMRNEIEKLKLAQNPGLMKHLKKTQKYIENVGKNAIEKNKERSSPFALFVSQHKNLNPELTKDHLLKIWFNLDCNERKKFSSSIIRSLDPIISKFRPDRNLGAISEELESDIKQFIDSNLKGASRNSVEDFKQILNQCYIRSLCSPGEAVGLLAAQSIGEPSTQMTLNTFHFAGKGEMNVTLGVPRLRELLMTASSNISTPSMDIPFKNDLSIDIEEIEKQAENVRLRMNAVRMKDILEYVDISEHIEIKSDGFQEKSRIYTIRFIFLPRSYYKHRAFTSPAKILQFFERKFLKKFIESINRRLLIKTYGLFDTKTQTNRNHRSNKQKTKIEADEEELINQNNDADDDLEEKPKQKNIINDDEEEEEDIDDYDVEDGEYNTTAMRQKSRINQDQEYEEPEQEEVEMDNADEIEDDQQSQQDNDECSDNIKQEILDDDVVQIEIDREKNSRTFSDKAKDRIQQVLNKFPGCIIDYNFDTEKELWCEIKLKFPLLSQNLDLRTIVEEETNKAFVHRFDMIDRVFLVKDNEAARLGKKFTKMIKTEGVSFARLIEFEHILDLNRIYTNDMHAIARTFGIEAARAALIREIKNVFAVYGISVDARHLSLIADQMTFSGYIKGMNRGAMDGISPLQAMTFETTTNFLKNSLLLGILLTIKLNLII